MVIKILLNMSYKENDIWNTHTRFFFQVELFFSVCMQCDWIETPATRVQGDSGATKLQGDSGATRLQGDSGAFLWYHYTSNSWYIVIYIITSL